MLSRSPIALRLGQGVLFWGLALLTGLGLLVQILTAAFLRVFLFLPILILILINNGRQ